MTKAIITDLDGTILPHKGNISQATIGCLEEIGDQGIVRIIATGRNLFAARKVLPENFPIDYLVFSSGAGVMRWRDKKILFSSHLSLKDSHRIADYLWDYNINFTIQREIPDNHLFYYTDIYPVHEDYRQRLETYKGFGKPIDCTADICSQATQFVMILGAMQIRLVEQIRSDLTDYSVIRTTSPVDHKAIWLEVFPKGINKGSTCTHLLNELGLCGAECAGIGNDYNDVDFLDICGLPYLVANAPNQLKPHYKSVASDRDNGFMEFINKTCK